MQTVAIKINDSAYEKVMYLLKNLSKDVEIVGSFDIETLDKKDTDYALLSVTRGEKSRPLEDVIKDFQ